MGKGQEDIDTIHEHKTLIDMKKIIDDKTKVVWCSLRLLGFVETPYTE